MNFKDHFSSSGMSRASIERIQRFTSKPPYNYVWHYHGADIDEMIADGHTRVVAKRTFLDPEHYIWSTTSSAEYNIVYYGNKSNVEKSPSIFLFYPQTLISLPATRKTFEEAATLFIKGHSRIHNSISIILRSSQIGVGNIQTFNPNVDSFLQMISDHKNDFIYADQLLNMFSKIPKDAPNNIVLGHILDLLGPYHIFNEDLIVRLKIKLGLTVNPDDISDKTLVDLL